MICHFGNQTAPKKISIVGKANSKLKSNVKKVTVNVGNTLFKKINVI
jgi:hypothetical protein